MLNTEEFAAFGEQVRAVTLERNDERWGQLQAQLDLNNLCVRWRNASGCSDGCCDLDQLVLEEHINQRNAGWAVTFNDNAIRPLRTQVVLTRDELEGQS